MQKIVLFDMDGTVVDSKKDITASVNYVRKKNHKLSPLSESFIVEAINMYERNLPYLFYGTKEYELRDRELFEEHYAKECIKNPFLYDGIKEMLHVLKKSGVKMSIATNAPTFFAKKILKHLHIDRYFDMIVGADKVKASKPKPDMIYKILDFYQYKKEYDQAWMVGDNSKDIESAKSAEIEAVFVTWGFSRESKHHITAQKPIEIVDIISIL